MDFEKLTELIIELEVDDIADAVKEALEQDGKDPFEILNALTKGMDEVGKRYEEKEYYLTELVLAGETMKEAFNVLQPALAPASTSLRLFPMHHDCSRSIFISAYALRSIPGFGFLQLLSLRYF